MCALDFAGVHPDRLSLAELVQYSSSLTYSYHYNYCPRYLQGKIIHGNRILVHNATKDNVNLRHTPRVHKSNDWIKEKLQHNLSYMNYEL